MSYRIACMLLLCVAALTSGPAWSLDAPTTGVVAMHGKWGNTGHLARFGSALSEAGFLVERPEMPWSGSRLFDRSFDEGIAEIDAAVERLKAKGARHIVVAGHSLGGDAALAYSARGRPLAALVLFAPAHFPDGSVFKRLAADGVEKARAMVAEGKGDDTASFMSYNTGDRTRSIRATAKNYLSYYAPDAPSGMSLFASSVGPAPILWLAPTRDPTTKAFQSLVAPRLPAATPLTRQDIPSDHADAVEVGAARAVEWLKALPNP
jgi:dienelactone hydrolase